MSQRTYYIPWAMIDTGALRRMTSSAAKVFLALVAHDGPEGCFPGYATLAKECDLDERTVELAVANLEVVGVVGVTRRSGKANRYTFLPPSSTGGTPSPPPTNVPTTNEGTTPHIQRGYTPLTRCGSNIQHEHTANNTKQLTGLPAGSIAAALDSPAGSEANNTTAQVGSLTAGSSNAGSAGVPAVITIAPPAKPRGAGKQKSKPLSDEDMNAIRVSPLTIAAYYLFGRDAVGKPQSDWAKMSPSNTNWAPSADYSRPDAGVDLPALAAYVWFRTMCGRLASKEPLSLPSFGKILGVIRNLRKRMPQAELVGHIDRITKNWPAIRESLAWMSSLSLDEGVLGRAEVLAASDRLGRGESLARTPASRNSLPMPSAPCNIDFESRVANRSVI